MNPNWQRFLAPFTPSVRILVFVLCGCFGAALIGRYSGAFDLYYWLALSSPGFWSGAFWQALSYVLLPATYFDFLINGFMLVWLGIFLERVWSQKEFWIYFFVCAAGGGLARAVLQPYSPMLMVGTAGVVFGFLVAWGRIFRYERVLLMCIWEMSIGSAAIFLGVFTLFLTLPCAGPINALILLCGGLTGWLYLTVRWKITGWRPCAVVNSDRIGRLEL